jgi:tungstate transport system substrate-binding protein
LNPVNRRPFILTGLLVLVLSSCGSSTGEKNSEVILATTTSTYDSGLLDVLIPVFEDSTDYSVKPIAVGTGRALAMAERGEADVLLVHGPSAEEKLLEAGAVVSRTLVMHNFFVLVGPSSDPAGLRGVQSAATAMSRIADHDSLFISRGDDSGTHKMELGLWTVAGINPSASWYQEAGQGMGATLGIASEKSAYTLTDMGTFLALKDNLHLKALVDRDPSLLNIYSVLPVNGDRFPEVNSEGAGAFAEFLVSAQAQDLIRVFGVEKFGKPLFIPDAGKTEGELGR